jgi:hypothetical protein
MKTIVKFVKTLCASSILVIGVICIIGSGDGGSDNSNSNVSSLSSMDISGAKALVIASKNVANSASTRDANGDSDVLYKLTENGLLIEVIFYDDLGNQVSNERYLPEYIEDINDDYVFMKFGGGPWPSQYIVQKSTGHAFQMQNEAAWYEDVLLQKHYFHSQVSGDTHDGNAYYLRNDKELNGNELRRIVLNPSGVLTDTRVSAKGDSLSHTEGGGPMTAIAADGTILYKMYRQIGDEARVITKNGQVIDLLSEIILNQPEMKQFLLGEIPGYGMGFGDPFVGADGGIYFLNHQLMNYLRNELYFVPQYADHSYPEFPPDPSGPTIQVYPEIGLPHDPYNPVTGLPVNLRNPIEVNEGVIWWGIDYVFPEDWDWFPEPYESAFENANLTDEWDTDPGPRYDQSDNPYRWNWYNCDTYSPVWRLESEEDGDFYLKPYGDTMATDSRWLLSKAPAGYLHYDSTIETQKAYWGRLNRPLILRCNSKIIAVSVDNGRIFETNNPGQGAIPAYSSSEIFSEVQDAEATSDYYYILGRTKDEAQISLYRFSAETHAAFELIDGSEYGLYAFTVADDNLVVFKAVRRSDGASIGGTINLDGEITIIEAIQDRNIVQLVRVL